MCRLTPRQSESPVERAASFFRSTEAAFGEADRSPLSTADVNKECSYTPSPPTPYVFIVWIKTTLCNLSLPGLCFSAGKVRACAVHLLSNTRSVLYHLLHVLYPIIYRPVSMIILLSLPQSFLLSSSFRSAVCVVSYLQISVGF